MAARLQRAGDGIRVTGRVVAGQRLGRRLGVPTANLRLAACPAALYGSYAAAVDAAGATYRGVAHVGVRPSVDGGVPLVEVHLFDFAGDLYGRRLGVVLLHKVSDEARLPSLAALACKIRDDVRRVRRFFARGGGTPRSGGSPSERVG